jgi:WD40 repeat protein
VGADNTTVIWNLASGEALFVRSDTDGRRVFFGPEDDTLITVNRDGFARIWSVNMSPPRQLEEIGSFAGHDTIAPIVTQSPDRSLLAFGTANGDIRLWRVPAGEAVLDIQAHSGNVQQIIFSPDSSLLASIGSEPGVRIWSVADGTLLYDLSEENATAMQAAFSPDSLRLAAASATGIQVWGLDTGQPLYSISTAENAASASLNFSPDGKLLAGCGQQALIGVWDSQNGELMGGLPLPGNQRCGSMLFSPDSKLLLTLLSPGRNVYLWDIQHITDQVPAEEKQLRRRERENMGLFPGRLFYSMAWSDDGRFIILVDELGPLHVVSAAE